MCRSATDLWLAAGGTSVAGVIAALRLHWDLVRDRRAWRAAVDRESKGNDDEMGDGDDDQEAGR